MSWIQGVLSCLANDKDFLVHCNEILKEIPLIPSKNYQLYSTRSQVLPLKCTSGKFSSRPSHDTDKFNLLLEKLDVPLLQHDIVKSIFDKIDNCLPSLLFPGDILKILFLLKGNNLHLYSKLSEEELHLLFSVLKMVSYSNRENQECIKHLPIFTTVNGRLVSLAMKSKVWI